MSKEAWYFHKLLTMGDARFHSLMAMYNSPMRNRIQSHYLIAIEAMLALAED